MKFLQKVPLLLLITVSLFSLLILAQNDDKLDKTVTMSKAASLAMKAKDISTFFLRVKSIASRSNPVVFVLAFALKKVIGIIFPPTTTKKLNEIQIQLTNIENSLKEIMGNLGSALIDHEFANQRVKVSNVKKDQ